MKSYTIILTSPKTAIPSDGIVAFIKDLIVSNLLNIDYFGIELDHQADYQDEKMIAHKNSSSFITLNFDSEVLDYKNFTEVETFQFIINLLEQREKIEILPDEKDITINL